MTSTAHKSSIAEHLRYRAPMAPQPTMQVALENAAELLQLFAEDLLRDANEGSLGSGDEWVKEDAATILRAVYAIRKITQPGVALFGGTVTECEVDRRRNIGTAVVAPDDVTRAPRSMKWLDSYEPHVGDRVLYSRANGEYIVIQAR